MRSNLHLFSMNWWRRQDFPVPALPITRNLNRKSAREEEKAKLNATPTSEENLNPLLCALLIPLSFYLHSIRQPQISLLITEPRM